MEIIEKDVDYRKVNLNEFVSNVSAFIDILKTKRFVKITLTYSQEHVEINAYLHFACLRFGIGSENVSLLGTELSSKDSQEKLVDLAIEMYHLD